MSEVSVIELIIYAVVAYTGFLALILSSFRTLPDEKSQSTIRSIWIIAPIICMFMLASAGAQINLSTETVLNYNVTANTLVSNSTTTETINFVNPVWVSLHSLFGIILIIYFIWNMLQLFTKIK